MAFNDVETGKHFHTTAEADRPVSSRTLAVRRASGTPLALFALASATFISSMCNIQARGITHDQAIVGHCLFSGGVAQILGGLWEFTNGNTLTGTIFTIYGSYFMSFGFIILPSTGIRDVYSDSYEFNTVLGVFYLVWALISFFLLVAVLKTNVCVVLIFVAVTASFAMDSAGKFLPDNIRLQHAGGGFGIAASMAQFYYGLSELLSADPSAIIQLPTGTIPVFR